LAGGELVLLALAVVLTLGLAEFELAFEGVLQDRVELFQLLGFLVEPGAHVLVGFQLVVDVLLLLFTLLREGLDFVGVDFVFALNLHEFTFLLQQFVHHFVVIFNFFFQVLLH